MIFNSKKFNIIAGLTLILIALIVGVSVVGVSLVEKDVVSQVEGSTSGTEEWVTPDDNNGQDVVAKDETKIEEAGLKKLTSYFSNSYQALMYSLQILENYNYSITSRQSVDAKVQIMGSDVGGVQKINKSIYHVDGRWYVKSVADGSNVPMGQGENYTEFSVVDNSNIVTKRVGGSSTSQSVSAYQSEFGILPNVLPYVLNKNTVTLSSLKNNPDLSYYEITATLKPKAWEAYLKSLAKNGGEGSNPKMSSIVLTLRIDKKYGTLESISATEQYTINRMGMAANATSKISFNFTYCQDYSANIAEIEKGLN